VGKIDLKALRVRRLKYAIALKSGMVMCFQKYWSSSD
jgi:hypothetical protein